MQHDNLIWLVPVIAGAIALYLLIEIGRFYISIRATPWQVYKDKRRKVTAMEAQAHREAAAQGWEQTKAFIITPIGERKPYSERASRIEVGAQILSIIGAGMDVVEPRYIEGIKHAYDHFAEKATDRRRLKVQVWVLIILGIIAMTIALASCGVISGANQHPYGKSYDQNNPSCTNRRP